MYGFGERVYHPEAVTAVKEELMQRRGVAIIFFATVSTMEETSPEGDCFNPYTCAHYCYDREEGNHAVCIAGWDDSYSRENFTPGHQPPADGAFIVKNSWGGKDSPFPDYNDEYGVDGTGYFYLSYYEPKKSTISEPRRSNFL